jgi:type I restriction enzyme S subunit
MPKQYLSARRGESELPNGWTWTTVGEITTPVEKVKPRERPDSEFIYLDISSINNSKNKITKPKNYIGADAPSRARQLVHANDVLFSTVRTYLKNIALVPEIYDGQIASTGFSVLRCRDRFSPKFLFYYTLTDDFISALSNLQRGTSYPAVRDSDVREQIIPLAPFNEQKRIVAKMEELFSQLDAGMAELRRVQANLARYKASVLKAACEGRLVPTEAELARVEGRDYESGEELLRRILDERKKKWEEEQRAKGKDPSKMNYREPEAPNTEGLPELPEGWVWAKWEQIGFSQNGRSFPSKEYQPNGVKLLRPGNLFASGKVIWTEENTRYLPEKWAEDHRQYVLGPGELIINLTAQSLKDEFLGRVCMTGSSDYCLLNQRIARLTPIEVLPSYLLWMFKSRIFRRFVDDLNTGSLIQHMFTSQLKEFILPLPPIEEQYRIVAEVERRLSVVEEMNAVVNAALKRSERLRQAILKQAFAGKLVPQDAGDEPAIELLKNIREGS